ncbi:family 72 glycoside hydrolase [Cryphonectria parasitica EP155]|uniref:1,3-beta-glucanosyltransferase n=1 Tax=Cryphonectria parasitica (strain ATCC 38755 / EP155) TaxID=660469 RepID=A0A9P4XV60_CRYP1|nr:family 72 glycoside hydrolase [Cryphonectria parasitica EP155]KAF3761578.1 family 72 glycoside hydrolase [Cryphonectria parasitica EP155]
MKTQTSLATAAALFTSFASALDYLSIAGSNFINNSTGDRFDIIGVTYQPGGSAGFDGTSDPLSDATACLRDAILLQQLGANTIRVYNLSPDLNHDQCASIFNAAGIYMIIDVNSGLTGQYIDRSDPGSTYTLDYMKHIFAMVEAFWSYPNLLGFFAGNEILNQDSSSDAPAYIRAVVRDMKEYIDLHAPRTIGVGYSAADVSTMLQDTWSYLGCTLENSTYSKMDFFGLNDYEWCGDSSYTESGYDTLVTDFSGTDIPVFFSEYGCNLVTPRTFTNVPVLYGSDMTELSGGLVYEYSQESDDYGLVAINSSTEVTLLEDYNFLKEEFAKIDTSLITAANKTAEDAAVTTCASSLITESTFLADWDLPTRPSGGDSLVTSGITSASTGAITSVTATSMPATVYNYTGATVTGLALNADSAGTASSNSSSSSKSAANAVSVDYRAMAVVGSIVAAFIGGVAAL